MKKSSRSALLNSAGESGNLKINRRRRKWLPLQYSCLGNSMGRGAWQAIVLGIAKESDTTEHMVHGKG